MYKSISFLTFFLSVLVFLSFILNQAQAGCSCQCVNGQVRALCSSAIDIKPICSPRVCPITPPSVKPIDTPSIPPIGTKVCTNMQVYNDVTFQYEWKKVCK